MEVGSFEQKWPGLKEAALVRWKRLERAELDQVAGNMDRLAELIQEKYGYSRDEARRDIERWNLN